MNATIAEAIARRSMGGHERTAGYEVWLTPPEIIAALGPFDLDPCAAPEPRPWPTAAEHVVKEEDGLTKPWYGRVWLNPPYGGPDSIGPWMRLMAAHGRGTALIFARTDTRMFHSAVWNAASAVLFLQGRLRFRRPDGSATGPAGAPSCLVAYGDADATILQRCGLAGHFVGLPSA